MHDFEAPPESLFIFEKQVEIIIPNKEQFKDYIASTFDTTMLYSSSKDSEFGQDNIESTIKIEACTSAVSRRVILCEHSITRYDFLSAYEFLHDAYAKLNESGYSCSLSHQGSQRDLININLDLNSGETAMLSAIKRDNRFLIRISAGLPDTPSPSAQYSDVSQLVEVWAICLSLALNEQDAATDPISIVIVDHLHTISERDVVARHKHSLGDTALRYVVEVSAASGALARDFFDFDTLDAAKAATALGNLDDGEIAQALQLLFDRTASTKDAPPITSNDVIKTVIAQRAFNQSE